MSKLDYSDIAVFIMLCFIYIGATYFLWPQIPFAIPTQHPIIAKEGATHKNQLNVPCDASNRILNIQLNETNNNNIAKRFRRLLGSKLAHLTNINVVANQEKIASSIPDSISTDFKDLNLLYNINYDYASLNNLNRGGSKKATLKIEVWGENSAHYTSPFSIKIPNLSRFVLMQPYRHQASDSDINKMLNDRVTLIANLLSPRLCKIAAEISEQYEVAFVGFTDEQHIFLLEKVMKVLNSGENVRYVTKYSANTPQNNFLTFQFKNTQGTSFAEFKESLKIHYNQLRKASPASSRLPNIKSIHAVRQKLFILFG